MEKFLGWLIAFIVVAIICAVMAFCDGYLIQMFWNNFVHPLGVPKISFKMALIFVLAVAWLRPSAIGYGFDGNGEVEKPLARFKRVLYNAVVKDIFFFAAMYLLMP